MFVGGLVLEYTSVTSSILRTLHTSATSSQIGAVGVVLIAIGALIILISLVGCCGALYESRGLLFIVSILLNFVKENWKADCLHFGYKKV